MFRHPLPSVPRCVVQFALSHLPPAPFWVPQHQLIVTLWTAPQTTCAVPGSVPESFGWSFEWSFEWSWWSWWSWLVRRPNAGSKHSIHKGPRQGGTMSHEHGPSCRVTRSGKSSLEPKGCKDSQMHAAALLWWYETPKCLDPDSWSLRLQWYLRKMEKGPES